MSQDYPANEPRDTASTRFLISEASELKLGRGIRMKYDNDRSNWTLMAPEKVIVLDEIAHEVIEEMLQSKQPLSVVIDTLTERYDAPREAVAGDVLEMVQMFADKKLVLPL